MVTTLVLELKYLLEEKLTVQKITITQYQYMSLMKRMANVGSNSDNGKRVSNRADNGVFEKSCQGIVKAVRGSRVGGV